MRKKEQDWIFDTDTCRCDLRSAGVLLQDGKVFLQRSAGGSEYALPGGHVRAGETTEHALLREWQEEMGVRVVCDRLLWVEECFWQQGGRQMHNLCFYYLIHLADGEALPDTGAFVPHRDNARVEAGYLSAEKLQEQVVYPDFLKTQLHALPLHPVHMVTEA